MNMPRNTRQQEPIQQPTAGASPEEIVAMAEERGLEVTEMSSFYKIAGDRKAMYVAKTKRTLTRIDLSGFELEHPAVEALSEDEARDLKLGRVRGQIFPQETRENWKEAIELSLDALVDDGVEGSKFQSRRRRDRRPRGQATNGNVRQQETARPVIRR